MKLSNLNNYITELDGKPAVLPNGKNLSIKEILETLCQAGFDGATLSDAVKLRHLAMEIYASKDGEIEIDADEAAVLKKAVEKNKVGYASVVQAQAYEECGLGKTEKK